MPKPRKALISLDSTAFYHCVTRCVRRAFLCGTDPLTKKNLEHRRGWIEDRMLELSRVFAIDICAYAVMSNHHHTVLHVDREKAESWSALEVIERWHTLFSGNHLSQRFVRGEALIPAEQRLLHELIAEWRGRLMEISWYMRCLNEPIARAANREDNCTGHFWEGRFSSQALLDEQALAAAMAYVDLNAIRAKMADTPEESDYTSIKRRIQQAIKAIDPNALSEQADGLMPFAGNPREEMPKGLPFRLTDYLELVEWSGRIIHPNKRGAIDASIPPILERLQIDPKHWLYLTLNFQSTFKGLVGTAYRVKRACKNFGYRRTPDLKPCEAYLG